MSFSFFGPSVLLKDVCKYVRNHGYNYDCYQVRQLTVLEGSWGAREGEEKLPIKAAPARHLQLFGLWLAPLHLCSYLIRSVE